MAFETPFSVQQAELYALIRACIIGKDLMATWWHPILQTVVLFVSNIILGKVFLIIIFLLEASGSGGAALAATARLQSI